MAHPRSALCDWKCRSGLLIWWWHARPLKRRCHLQSHREWHLQMAGWHLVPVRLKNKSDSFMGQLKLLSRSASWAWSRGCCWFFLVLPVYSGLSSFARGGCRGITVFTHTGPVWVTIWHFLWREALQSSSSGLFSDNSDSPLGPLNDTSLFLHCELVHRQFLFSSTFPWLVQGVYDHEIGCWAEFCFSRYTSWLLAKCGWL